LVLQSVVQSRKQSDEEQEEEETEAVITMSSAEFRESILLAYSAVQYALGKQEKHRNNELSQLVKSLKDSLSDWNILCRFMLLEIDDASIFHLDGIESTILVTVFHASVKFNLQVVYADSFDDDVFFEEVTQLSHAKPAVVVDKKQKRTQFVKDMQRHLLPILQQYAYPTAVTDGTHEDIAICKVISCFELALWFLVGMPSADGTFFSTGQVWLDLRKVSDYEQVVEYVCEQLYAKQTHGLILCCLARLLFGTWHLSDRVTFGLCENNNTLRHTAEPIVRRLESTIITTADAASQECQSLEGNDADEEDLIAICRE
jgi:hypothetical protein